jgi:Mn2+/Fe2+ NRAMP family transporter
MRSVGPEVIAAASDNDPTNVGTAVVVGSQTGYHLSWVAVLVAPMLAIVMTIAAQVGMAGRGDLQSLTLKRYGRAVAAVLLVSVVTVNLVTIAADLQAGAVGIGLLADVNPRWIVTPLGAALAALLLFAKYDKVEVVLRCLLLGFLAFGAAAFMARPDWPRVLRGTLVPVLSVRSADLTGSLALLGTTLTSYVYVWETVGRGIEVPTSRGRTGSELGRARLGAVIGAVVTALVLWFMLVASAATLGQHHMTITSIQEAAVALRPLAGPAAADLLAVGLVASAVVALPVLMATTAHVLGAQFNWRRGLSVGVRNARAFYAALVASIVIALAVTLANVSVIVMLEIASVIGGLGTPIGLTLLVSLARDPQVMGQQVISFRLATAGWAVAILFGTLGVVFLIAMA